MAVYGRGGMTTGQLEAYAWGFLRSDFTNEIYAIWPIDRRVDAYLHRQGRGDLVNDGDAYDALLGCVLEHIGDAVRRALPPSETN